MPTQRTTTSTRRRPRRSNKIATTMMMPLLTLMTASLLMTATTTTTRTSVVSAFAPPSLSSRVGLSSRSPASAAGGGNFASSATQTFLYVDPDDASATKPPIPRPLDDDNDKSKKDDAKTPQQEPSDEETMQTMPDVSLDMTDTTTAADEDRYLKMINSEYRLKTFLGENTKSGADLPLSILLGRTLDTMEDVVNIIRRKPYDYGWVQQDELEKYAHKTVVVLGSGWASHALIKAADTYSINVIVVSPVNHFVFTPMLASAAVGSVEYRSMTEAVRASNPMVQYIEGRATDVDVEGKKIKVELNQLLTDTEDKPEEKKPDPIEIDYDALVVAIGTRVKKSNVPGAATHCYYLKTCDDARRLRTGVGECLEMASRPDVAYNPPLSKTTPKELEPTAKQEERRRRLRFCIVGGGPTGVELAGELSDFFKDICHPRKGTYPKLKDDIEIMLVHGGSSLVPNFDESLRGHALASLEKRGVKVRLNTYTTEVGEDFVVLKDKHTGIEERIPVGLTVWAAGIEPVPFAEKMLDQLPSSARGVGGRINVDKWMRPPMPKEDLMGSIVVLGDAAAFVDDDEDENAAKQSYLPQTAQVAGQQGAFMARMLNRNYNMTATPPILQEAEEGDDVNKAREAWLRLRGLEAAAGFNFLNLGMLAYVGGGEALSQIVVGDVPLFAYAGSTGFILWRSVYLVKQVATRNRVLVTFDWVKTALFGRDVTRL